MKKMKGFGLEASVDRLRDIFGTALRLAILSDRRRNNPFPASVFEWEYGGYYQQSMFSKVMSCGGYHLSKLPSRIFV